jgi:hypothetical protein
MNTAHNSISEAALPEGDYRDYSHPEAQAHQSPVD